MMGHSPERIRALIVDDEVLARRTVRLLLEADPELEIVGECGTGREAVERLQRETPDLLFLDVQMPGVDGFEVLRQVGPERIPAIVFVTAFDQHALRAFEVQAIDYLLKPFDDERFARTLARAKALIRQGRVHDMARKMAAMLEAVESSRATPPPPAATPRVLPAPYLERLAVKDGHRISLLPTVDVDWIEAEDYYVQIHVGGKSYLLREPLKELEAKLDPRQFVRIHRSTIVNVNRVRELQPLVYGESVVILHDGTRLKLSRTRRDHLHALLGLP
jgi:two-component system LytT family response regulator